MSASIWTPGSTLTISSASLLALFQIRGGYCSVVAGTVDAIVLTPTTALTAYAAGQTFTWIASGDNTGPVTVAISGLAAVALTKQGSVALAAKDIPSGMMVEATFDGTRLILGEVSSVNKSLGTAIGDTVRWTAAGVPARLPAVATVAAHATITDIWTATETLLSGAVVTFTDIADAPFIGAVAWVKANAAHVWTNGTVFTMPGLADYTCAVGDWLRIEAITVSTFSVIVFKADGTAVVVASTNAFTTGDVKMTLKTVADSGWVLMDDKTIGNAASGATGRANADTASLYSLLWANTADAQCAVSTGRGASAAADYAANKTIALPKALGRALATYGSGSGLTARVLALTTGVETHPLVTGELASHTHTGTTASNGAHTHTLGIGFNPGGGSGFDDVSSKATATSASDGAHTHTITTDATGSGTAHQNMQPTLFLNTMIKL